MGAFIASRHSGARASIRHAYRARTREKAFAGMSEGQGWRTRAGGALFHSFEDKAAALSSDDFPFSVALISPSSGNEAKAWMARPNVFRTNLGVVPLTRPSEISDFVSLSDKL
jgi:hypothetical protein